MSIKKTIECAEVPYTISYTYGQLFPPSSLSSVNGNSVTEDIKWVKKKNLFFTIEDDKNTQVNILFSHPLHMYV